MNKEIKLSTIEEALKDFREGKFVIVVDDEDRENEGDFITAAELITEEKVNFMLKYGRGVLCAPITMNRASELELEHQVVTNTSMLGTPFTVTVDLLEGCTTGVSAHDRAATIRALADAGRKPSDFGRPGHINPLYAQDRGVLRRAGHTEAAVDLARLSGLQPAAALIEILNEDGTMARMPELKEVAHIALVKGEWNTDDPILVRMHSSCMTGDIFGSRRCDCGEQLHRAMKMIDEAGRGVIVYLQQEGRGIGLMNKIAAYKLQEQGEDTVDANIHLGFLPDEREYGVGAQILRELHVGKIRLITNNPVKRVGLESYGLEIVENVPVIVEPNEYNRRYLDTKKLRMGHKL